MTLEEKKKWLEMTSKMDQAEPRVKYGKNDPAMGDETLDAIEDTYSKSVESLKDPKILALYKAIQAEDKGQHEKTVHPIAKPNYFINLKKKMSK